MGFSVTVSGTKEATTITSLPTMSMQPDETDAQLVEVIICLGPGVGKQKDLLLVPPLYNPVNGIFFSALLDAQYKRCSC